MSFVIWIVLGLAAGFVGGRRGKRKGEGILPDIVLGLVGALAGGWLCYTFGPMAEMPPGGLFDHLQFSQGSSVKTSQKHDRKAAYKPASMGVIGCGFWWEDDSRRCRVPCTAANDHRARGVSSASQMEKQNRPAKGFAPDRPTL